MHPAPLSLAALLAELVEVMPLPRKAVLEIALQKPCAYLRLRRDLLPRRCCYRCRIAALGFPRRRACCTSSRAKAKLCQPGRAGRRWWSLTLLDPNAEVLGGVEKRRHTEGSPSLSSRCPSREDLLTSARGWSESTDLVRGCCFTASAASWPSVCRWSHAGRDLGTGRGLLAWAMEIDEASVVAGLESVQPIAGHLEAVVEGQDFEVRIDAAQTPDDIAEALAAVRALSTGRVHLVLSTEGGGNRAVRRRLAEIGENGADRVILTLSNPRTEDPNQILDDLLAGFRHPGKVRVEPDRQTAIKTVLAHARIGDVVIIGKGCHTYQIFADCVIPFDDSAVARQWLRANPGRLAQHSA